MDDLTAVCQRLVDLVHEINGDDPDHAAYVLCESGALQEALEAAAAIGVTPTKAPGLRDFRPMI